MQPSITSLPIASACGDSPPAVTSSAWSAPDFDDGNPQAADPIDRASDRPDFVISSYGGLTLQAGIAKPGAMANLFVNSSLARGAQQYLT